MIPMNALLVRQAGRKHMPVMTMNMLVVQVAFSALTNDGPTASLVWPNCYVANCLRILGAVWTLFWNLVKYILN
jgi:hypothetical protein